MSFLRRLLGRPEGDETAPDGETESLSPDDEERAHELELARFEQERTTDLMRRQQRYEDRAWTPPAQGGSKRADGEEADEA